MPPLFWQEAGLRQECPRWGAAVSADEDLLVCPLHASCCAAHRPVPVHDPGAGDPWFRATVTSNWRYSVQPKSNSSSLGPHLWVVPFPFFPFSTNNATLSRNFIRSSLLIIPLTCLPPTHFFVFPQQDPGTHPFLIGFCASGFPFLRYSVYHCLLTRYVIFLNYSFHRVSSWCPTDLVPGTQ